MVSFWPWKGDDNSPASFERALANLSEKIQTNTIRLDSLRQQSRRFTVLWMLYAGFAYLLCAIILVLVVGWRNWGTTEYTAVAGSPVVIYLVRLALTTYYEYRTSSIQAQVDDLQKQRDVTIKKLKTATKYDSTQELLKKYGGTPTPKPKPAGGSERKVTPKQGEHGIQQGGRTGFAPPPTANIPGRQISPPQQGTPQRQVPSQPQQQPSPHQQQFSPQQQSPNAEFAPNAFPSAPQYAPTNEGSHWYDRFMDVLLGDDETLPGKRLALICRNCRLVNGQAPPGVKRVEDVGRWRCGGCGTMNGEENDVKSIVENIKKQEATEPTALKKDRTEEEEPIVAATDDAEESDVTVYTEDEEEAEDASEKSIKAKGKPETPSRRSTRPKKGKKET